MYPGCTTDAQTKKPDRDDPAKFGWKCLKRLNLQRGTLTGHQWEEECAQEMSDICASFAQQTSTVFARHPCKKMHPVA
jgi:hypothetical protein